MTTKWVECGFRWGAWWGRRRNVGGHRGDVDDVAEVASPSLGMGKPVSGDCFGRSGCSGDIEFGAWLSEDVEGEWRDGGENALLRWCERLAEAMEEEGSDVVD